MGDAQADIRLIREAVGRAQTAIRLNLDPVDAFRDATALSEVGDEIRSGAGHLRADIAAELAATSTKSLAELGEELGLSKPGLGRLVRIGKGRESAALCLTNGGGNRLGACSLMSRRRGGTSCCPTTRRRGTWWTRGGSTGG